jgi:hypothetical protein
VFPLPILIGVTFRDRLVATIRAARPVIECPGVLVVGSEVPNLLERGAAATLVVSQDLDVGVPVGRHAALKERLGDLVLEKLVTDRTGEKGERDLLVALGVLTTSAPEDLDELETLYRRLRPELRHAVPRGVWFRLRRVLTLAREAYAVPPDEAKQLIAEGHRPQAVGGELEPSRIILFVPAERVARIASARRLAVRLSAEMLSAECLALVPFETEGR